MKIAFSEKVKNRATYSMSDIFNMYAATNDILEVKIS